MRFENLFKPMRIGPVDIENRIAMAPMGTNYAWPGGYPSEQTFAYYAARAKGGTGLMITEAAVTNQLAYDTVAGSVLTFHEAGHVPAMSELADRAHAFGAKIFVQLSPGNGRQGTSRTTGVQLVAPSAVPWVTSREYLPEGLKGLRRLSGEIPRELTVEEIVEMEDRFAEAARWARWAGFDGIEIHSPHGYLIAQFLSPRANKRTDAYGGNLENRMRFLLNIIGKTREKIGDDMALGARLSGDEHTEGGLTNEDFKVIAKELEKAGLDYIHLSSGTYERMSFVFPEKDGTMLDEAKGFKEVLNIPVITPSLHDPYMAEQAIKDGKTDMVSLGRQLITDPEWANKVKEGRIDEIRRCDRDNKCLLRLFRGLPIRCAINPDSGRERYIPEYWQPPQKLEV